MDTAAKPTRENRTITVDFRNETTYFSLLDGKAFVECVLGFLVHRLSTHTQGHLSGGRGSARHSHYARVRLGGVTIWRLQCTTCKAVFTVLPHFVLRYRSLRPEVARDALLATHGGLSLELCAVICHLSPMALYRLVCAFGQQSLVTVLTRCGLPLPSYFLADEKHSRCLTDKVYLPTIVSGRVIWHLGYTEDASAAAFTQSYGVFQRAACQQEPSYRVRGSSPMASIVRPGVCGRCSLGRASATACAMRSVKLPKKLAAIASPVRKALRSQFHTLLYRARQRKGLRVFALGQRLRHFADHVTPRRGRPTASACDAGSRTRRRAGMRCSQTRRCR